VTVHAPIGLRNILSETIGWRGPGLDAATAALALALAAGGLRAVYAVVI
jgi:fumarate reductase subunit C